MNPNNAESIDPAALELVGVVPAVLCDESVAVWDLGANPLDSYGMEGGPAQRAFAARNKAIRLWGERNGLSDFAARHVVRVAQIERQAHVKAAKRSTQDGSQTSGR